MKVELRFNGKSKQMLVIPESGRDKILLKLFSEDTKIYKADIKADECLIIEPVAVEQVSHLASQPSLECHQEDLNKPQYHSLSPSILPAEEVAQLDS